VGPVYVDSTEILYLESFPVQVRLVVRGSLPTPCHQARWGVDDSTGELEVTLWSVVALGQLCAQVLEPFEVTIPLGSFEESDNPVLLNGEQIGRVAIGGKSPALRVPLVGAGWSFGMCGGYCQADLVFDAESLVLTGRGWIIDEPLYVHRGTLTTEGRDRISAAVARLSGAGLEDVYGCPDCADGGAFYVVLDRAGVVSRHDMDFGRPPDILTELHGLGIAFIDALETCQSDELVMVSDNCVPWQGP
jgi:hypothetical protein